MRACAALVAASLLVGTAARAEGRAQPSAADRETARSLMQQGRELREKGDLQQALKRFKAADDIMHVPTTGLEVARTQVSLGQLVEARDTIAALRQWTARPSDPAVFNEARTRAEQLDASLNGRVPAVTIGVKGAGASDAYTVTIDDAPVPSGALGLPRSVDPGHHVVVAKTANAEAKAEVDLREGEQKPIELTLASTAPPPPPEPAATTPSEGETSEETPPGRSHSPGVLTWVGVGVGGAGLVAGAVTGALALSKKSSLDAACANKVCGPDAYGDLDAANAMATVSSVAFAVAGAGAAAAIVSLVVGHSESSSPAAPAAQPPSETSLRVAPWLGLGTAGVHGTF